MRLNSIQGVPGPCRSRRKRGVYVRNSLEEMVRELGGGGVHKHRQAKEIAMLGGDFDARHRDFALKVHVLQMR